jgi:hypothetical protein
MEESCSGAPPDSSERARQMMARGGRPAVPIDMGTKGSGPL